MNSNFLAESREPQSSTYFSPALMHRIEFYDFEDHELTYTEEENRRNSNAPEILLRVKTPSLSTPIKMPPSRSSEGFWQLQQITWAPSRDSTAATGSGGGIGSVNVEGGRGDTAFDNLEVVIP